MRERRSPIEFIVLSVIFGFGAGIVGMLWAAVYLLPVPSFTGSVFPVSREPVEARVADVDIAGRAAAQIFVSRQESADPLADAYLPGDALASGVVLTSDGWILSHGDAAAKTGRRVAVVGNRAYRVEETVVDPFSGVVFLKVNGANLPVTALSETFELTPGEEVFSFDGAGGLRKLDVIGMDEVPAKTPKDLLQSSERLQKALRLSDGADLAAGAMILDRKGELVGIFTGPAVLGSAAVRLDSFSRQIGAVLREKRAVRPYLGVHYADLSRLPVSSSAGFSGRGALLVASSDGKTPAVDRRSPAEEAGLRRGDVITAVDGEEVSSNRALSDLLSEYEPESTVSFTVQRGKAVLTVDVVLSTAPSL